MKLLPAIGRKATQKVILSQQTAYKSLRLHLLCTCNPFSLYQLTWGKSVNKCCILWARAPFYRVVTFSADCQLDHLVLTGGSGRSWWCTDMFWDEKGRGSGRYNTSECIMQIKKDTSNHFRWKKNLFSVCFCSLCLRPYQARRYQDWHLGGPREHLRRRSLCHAVLKWEASPRRENSSCPLKPIWQRP